MLEDELKKQMRGIGILSGLAPSFVSIMAELYFEPEEISMDELAKRTGYSLGSISMKIKIIEQMGFLSRRKHPGTSKVFLFMEKDLFGHSIRKWIDMKQRNIERLKLQIPKLVKKYSKTKLTEREKAQLEIAKNDLEQAVKMEKIINMLKEKIL